MRGEYRNIPQLLLMLAGFNSIIAGAALAFLVAWWWGLVGLAALIVFALVSIELDKPRRPRGIR